MSAKKKADVVLVDVGSGEVFASSIVGARLGHGHSFDYDCGPEPSRTSQEFAAECDVNVIMAQYAKTGVLPRYGEVEPVYIDWSEPTNFMDAMNLSIKAEAEFMRLPAAVRKEFDNDPRKFVAYAERSGSDPSVNKRMVEWGLAAPPPLPDAPMRVEVVNQASGEPAAQGAGAKPAP